MSSLGLLPRWAVLASLCVLQLSVACSDEATPSIDDDDGTSEESDPSTDDDDDDAPSDGADASDPKRDSGARDASARSDAAGDKKDSGVPRAPSVDANMAATNDGGAGGAADASMGKSDREDLGQGDGKDVITIGDSWMLLRSGVGIEVSLEKASMRDYRNFGVPGTRVLDGVIPRQYETAKMQGADIKTVIMTGGGNDIIQAMPTQCVDSAFGDACKAQIDKVSMALTKLWEQMRKDGVRDVVIIGYTRKAYLFLPTSTLSKSAEYSAMTIPPLCEAVQEPLRCHVLDSDLVFDGATMEGIHPTNAGYDAIGKAVWDLMKEKGLRR